MFLTNWDSIWNVESSDYAEGDNSDEKVGVSGKRTFVINVNDKGKSYITFIYGKPWLYDNTLEVYSKTGLLDASIMEGIAIQLGIETSD